MTTVLCVGCFDLFHYGHLRHLEAAREMGDELIVGITRDRSVDKGEGRPYINEKHREAIVGAIWCVDRTFLCDTSIEALKTALPEIFCLGQDYKGKVRKEDRAFCKKEKIRIAFTYEPRMSSTEIYDRLTKV